MNSIKIGLKIVFLTVLLFGLYLVGSQFIPDTGALQMTTREANQLLLTVLGISFIEVLLLYYLISRTNLLGWRLAGVVAILLLGIKTALPLVESLSRLTEMPAYPLKSILLFSLPTALIMAPLAVLVFSRFWGIHYMPPRKIHLDLSPWGWLWKTAFLAGILYPLLYFTAGYFVTWQSVNTQLFFSQGELAPYGAYMLAILRDSPSLLLLQIGRGFLGLLLAVLIMAVLRTGVWETAIFTGLAFALMMNNVLLIPNPLIPESFRLAHFFVTAGSNSIWGALIILVLIWQPQQTREQPTAVTSRLAQ